MSFSDVRRLRAFALVVDLGSISAAATVLGYTQSAVSQQLAALEREAGAALVDRARRPFRATPAGEALRPHANRILAAVTAAETALEAGGRLRLAAFPSALSSFVATAVRELRRTEPELVVQVLQCETLEAIDELARGAADLAVVHHMPGVPVPPTPGMERRPLLTDELCAVLPERHRLARREQVRIADLEGEPLLVPRRDTPAGRFRSLVEHLCAEAGFAPRIAYEVDDLVAAQSFAAAGIAAVLMHGLTLAAPVPGVAIRRLVETPAGSRTVEAVLPPGPRPAPVEDLLGHLTRTARSVAPVF
jgi:DNA-binding transcriptional LysR family regulator